MILLLISDMHLSTDRPFSRSDDFEETQKKKLEYVFQRAQQEDAVIIQAGDLCDRPRNWVLCHWLASFLESWQTPFYMVRGQHDIYMRSDIAPTTVLVLEQTGLIQLLDNKTTYWTGTRIEIGITGVPFGQDPPSRPPVYDLNILVIHAPIADIPIPGMPEFVDARKFAEKNKGYDLILCGDIHRHFLIKTKYNTILNTGPMIRREATEYNFQHQPCFYLFDTETRELRREIIPHAPADLIMTRKHLEAAKETEGMMVDFIERVRKTLDQGSPGVDVTANFKRAMDAMDLPKTTRELIMEVVDATGK